MSELERSLTSLASAVEWPPTPHMQLRLRERRQRSVPRLAIALALFALALGVALAVPQARSAILRLFHIGGVTIVRVDTLPQAQDRALGVDLGMLVTRSEAERTLLGPVRVPPLRGAPRFHELGNMVSLLIRHSGEPLLLSELRIGGNGVIPEKLLGPTTKLERTTVVSRADAVWLTGARHVVVFPDAPPRLAGNVLLWASNGITYRLEGRGLDEHTALRLAREIMR